MPDFVSHTRSALLTLTLAAPFALASPLDAQRSARAHFEDAHPKVEIGTIRATGQRPVPLLAASGVVFGAAGLYAGALIGDRIGSRNPCSGEDCNLEEVFIGGGVGMSLMIPLGVHIANNRKGSYLKEVLASGAIYAAGMLVGFNGAPIALLAIPPAQIASSILIERATAH